MLGQPELGSNVEVGVRVGNETITLCPWRLYPPTLAAQLRCSLRCLRQRESSPHAAGIQQHLLPLGFLCVRVTLFIMVQCVSGEVNF
ncbi:hypothetical protein VTK73DRAFT_2027 [Phialemonium thermophilum]|uniref:Uncharacterized protein n=1 Tax=Phialemonium thermophilum TaxID=223376 RepID=A0ABR3X6M9_9PEZI